MINYFDLKKEGERVFSDSFKKVDEESELFAPENVGSTAVVAVTSSHVIVTNCGDSRAVLSRGKQAIPLSIDHKVRLYYFLHDTICATTDIQE